MWTVSKKGMRARSFTTLLRAELCCASLRGECSIDGPSAFANNRELALRALANRSNMSDASTARHLRSVARDLRQFAKSELETNKRSNPHAALMRIAGELHTLSLAYDDGRVMLP